MKHPGNALGAVLCALALFWLTPASAQAPGGATVEAGAPLLQNILGREHQSINCRWNYIVDRSSKLTQSYP